MKSSKQKAVEAYALINKLPYSLTYLAVLCKNAVKEPSKNNTYLKLMSEFNNKTPEIVEELELIIVGNFTDLQSDLMPIKKELNDFSIFLMETIPNPSTSELDVEKRWEDFQINIIASTYNLTSKLLAQHQCKIAKNKFFYS